MWIQALRKIAGARREFVAQIGVGWTQRRGYGLKMADGQAKMV